MGSDFRHGIQGEIRRLGEGQNQPRLQDVHVIGAVAQEPSEKLLDRRLRAVQESLARIVDLERYQKLHGKADDRRPFAQGRQEL